MKRLRILLFTLFCVALFSANAAQGNQRPNIVFILVDDLRIGTLGIDGHPFSKTPNIDRIAREGAIFRNAFVTTPLCSPARGSFLTGQYARTHKILDNADHQKRSHELITFPLLLQKAGYESAYVGKWHMGNHDEPKPGYDHWISFKGQGVFENPTININGKSQKTEGYITDILSQHAAEFIERKHEKPFVLYLSHKAVHGPFTPAARHKDSYLGKTMPAPPNVKDSLDGKLAIKHARTGEKNQNRPRANPFNEKLMRAQVECLRSIDEGVGLILAALEKAGQLDNTLVIFTSDNGYFWGEHGLGDKRWAYEESIRIPMLMRYPKLIKAGAKPEQMALNVDIAPTLLDLAGVSIPKDMHGKSLVPVVTGRARNWRDAALFEYFVDRQFPRFHEWQAVRTGEWKYIRYTALPDADELYDLKNDPYEMKNLSGEKSAQKTLGKMKSQLERSLAEIVK